MFPIKYVFLHLSTTTKKSMTELELYKQFSLRKDYMQIMDMKEGMSHFVL